MPPRAKGSEGRSNAPVLPTITATRPSLETQREPPERVTVDPSKLGHNAAVKAKGAPKREQKATLRNELFKEIGIEAWFKENAIPYDFTPTKKSSRNNFLTASNVSQSQLEKVYRWTFFKGRAGESAPLRLVMDNIEAILLDRKSHCVFALMSGCKIPPWIRGITRTWATPHSSAYQPPSWVTKLQVYLSLCDPL
ncbi:hypothetical protein SCP_0603470 [Sparassis crispa]|uniref:Uncharacterized protein n=1 Tax=Sparassis crispa TaxID=139825 RepID=A0A401GQ75_9APHY|nr:hypothetical protein SCP_0603470 [Sparassis crispa]GBE84368.1 hypothetical protein SCP_0603470 [Sparassis crispa]